MSSENSLSFFGAGGHSHNGVNSTLIDTTRYSIFDFSLGFVGSQARINSQSVKQRSFEDYVIRIINSQVLQPAGLSLDPDTLNGKTIRANTITSTEIQARTITSEEIRAATITANELTSNIVLVNNIIRSNNFNGTFHANGVVNSTGTTGWGISYAGSSVFNNVTIRGAIESSTISGTNISGGTITIGSSNNVFKADSNGIYLGNATFGSAPFRVGTAGALTATSATVSGVLTTGVGSNIGGWSTDSNSLFKTTSNGTVRLTASTDPYSIGSISIAGAFSGTSYSSLMSAGDIRLEASAPGFSAVNDITVLDISISRGSGEYVYIRPTGSSIFNSGNDNNDGTIIVQRGFNTPPIKHLIEFRSIFGANAGEIALTSATSVAYVSSSDRRIKENVKSIENALETVKKIEPVSYTFIDEQTGNLGEPFVQDGFIAQDLYEVYSKPVVVPPKEEMNWGIDYGKMTPLLTAAIKEIAIRLEKLESMISHSEFPSE
jgi:hypothetical protein